MANEEHNSYRVVCKIITDKDKNSIKSIEVVSKEDERQFEPTLPGELNEVQSIALLYAAHGLSKYGQGKDIYDLATSLLPQLSGWVAVTLIGHVGTAGIEAILAGLPMWSFIFNRHSLQFLTTSVRELLSGFHKWLGWSYPSWLRN